MSSTWPKVMVVGRFVLVLLGSDANWDIGSGRLYLTGNEI